MVIRILSDHQRLKDDISDDDLFYAQPRFVQHLDFKFRSRLSKLYQELLVPSYVVVDLMSSWVSHLPDGISFKEVIGHGLNSSELKANKRLDRFWIQNLNTNFSLPLKKESVDAFLIVAGWQYLQYPEDIAHEIYQILKPGGKLIVSFTNRAFWQKSPYIWKFGDHKSHIEYIKSILIAQGWAKNDIITYQDENKTVLNFLNLKTDPFYSVVALKSTIEST